MGEEVKSTVGEMQQCKNEIVTTVGWYRQITYDDAKNFIRDDIVSIARNFISVGYYLKFVRDDELYREDHYASIWEFAYAEFGLSKSAASRYMSMNDRFSLEGNSPVVDQKYKDFSKSKLQEMLSLTDEQLEQVTPEMKVQEIRSMRQPKETTYFEIEGQLDLEKDFPEVITGTMEAPVVMPEASMATQPVTIQTTMTLDEMMGGEELDEQPEKLSAYGTPKRVYPEGSLLTEPSCEGGHYCFSCPEMKCDIRGKERQCWYAPCGNPFPCEIVAERSLDLLTEQMGDKCQFVNHNLAYHCAGNEEPAPCCCRCENPCNLACKRVAIEKEQERSLMVLEADAQPSESDDEEQWFENDCSRQDEERDKDPEPIEYDRYTLENMIQDAKKAFDLMSDHWINDQPYTYAKYSMMIQAYEMLLQVHDAADPEPAEVEQTELPVMKNNDQRKEWLRNYKPWGVWYKDEHIGSTFYKYDFECGARLIVEVFAIKNYCGNFTHANYHLVGGPEPPKGANGFEKWTRHEEYNHYPDNETELVEFLKYIQKGEK
ncbi:hypothetical protein [Clostridium sp. AM42-4]|uniref:hypothetical protein n=1 Tax=Clostridium sp. AM42-4 TaxID=2292305 RepID=UPI000E520434|nr:hypothetical protein [Clostridium sp. AM42-4]RHS85486.1 hypothetical protein DW922_11480 [Clostridium sp. AM42-4]